MNLFIKKLAIVVELWLPFAIIVTMLCGLIFGVMQRDLRQSANDPQIQLAEDIAASMLNSEYGDDISSITDPQPIDVAKSLAPFVIIFDDNKEVIASSVILGDKTPIPPPGVFDYAKNNGENRITWQPHSAVRIAMVMTRFTGEQSGYVLAGRSLREVENREKEILLITIVAWIFGLFATFILALISARNK